MDMVRELSSPRCRAQRGLCDNHLAPPRRTLSQPTLVVRTAAAVERICRAVGGNKCRKHPRLATYLLPTCLSPPPRRSGLGPPRSAELPRWWRAPRAPPHLAAGPAAAPVEATSVGGTARMRDSPWISGALRAWWGQSRRSRAKATCIHAVMTDQRENSRPFRAIHCTLDSYYMAPIGRSSSRYDSIGSC